MSELTRTVGETGKIKSHIRLARAISQFGHSLDTIDPGSRTIFKNIQSRSRPTEANEVIRLTEEVNRDGSRLHKTWRPHGTRLVTFLEQLRVFGKAGDVLVGGSQNIIECGVWAVIRVFLHVIIGHMALFDKLSLLWLRLGRSSLMYDNIVSLYPNVQDLQDFMCEYLIVVVDHCQRIAQFVSKRTILQLASQFTTFTDKEFQDFEDKLRCWGGLIDQRLKYIQAKSQLEIENSTAKTRLGMTSIRNDVKQIQYAERRLDLYQRLSPSQDDFDLAWRRQRRKGTVNWIFENEDYVMWKSKTSRSLNDRARNPPTMKNNKQHILVISGSLGSGKSVLMANIVADLTNGVEKRPEGKCRYIVAKVFCAAESRITLDSDAILGSIIFQFLRQLGDDYHDFLSKFSCETSDDSRMLWGHFQDVFGEVISLHDLFVVIDGLDNCVLSTQREVMETLVGTGQSLRICYSCQSNSTLKDLVGCHTIAMSNDKRSEEIASFVAAQVESRRQSRGMSPELAAAVRDALITGAQGMYLWVVLQLERIFPRDHGAVLTDSDILGILDDLPSDLNAAFEDVLKRIRDTRYGGRIFMLVAAAERLLTAEELAIALNVKPNVIAWNPSTLAHDPHGLVSTCSGCLLEVDEEKDTVHFIHHSAFRYLLDEQSLPKPNMPGKASPPTLQFRLDEAARCMATTCLTFLHLPIHTKQLTKYAQPVNYSKFVDQFRASTEQRSRTARLLRQVTWNQSGGSKKVDVDIALERVAGLTRNAPQHDKGISSFLIYAQDNWLHHAHDVSEDTDPDSSRLFSLAVWSDKPHILKPWGREGQGMENMFEWALAHGHLVLIRSLLLLPKPHVHNDPLPMAATIATMTIAKSSDITGARRHDIFQHVFEYYASANLSLYRSEDVYNTLLGFLELGVDPCVDSVGGSRLLCFVASHQQHCGYEQAAAIAEIILLQHKELSLNDFHDELSPLGHAIKARNCSIIRLLCRVRSSLTTLSMTVSTNGMTISSLFAQSIEFPPLVPLSLVRLFRTTCFRNHVLFNEVRQMRDQAAQMDPDLTWELYWAVGIDSITPVSLQCLIDYGAFPSVSLAKAVAEGNMAAVICLLANGADPDWPVKTRYDGAIGKVRHGDTARSVIQQMEVNHRETLETTLALYNGDVAAELVGDLRMGVNPFMQ